MQQESKTEQLRAIRDEVWNLTDSSLYKYRKQNNYYPVLGDGSHDAKIMFIGEAPGEKEALSGRPFCGAAGKMLDTLLESIGLLRADVYITNIVKDRPQDNRDPIPEEIALYAPFLNRQIEIIRPRVIATLGRYSMKYIFEHLGLASALKPISVLHGASFEGKTAYGAVTLIPLYHPAVALYNGSMRGTLKNDFKIIKKILVSITNNNHTLK
ncbi:MAG: uracil-DNA glycosylase [Parcubacteria group bacterium]|nr:uracil-DNA glycosylase [Parcubacteria group bacterium]